MLRRRSLLLPLATLALAGCAPLELPLTRTFPVSVSLPATAQRCIDTTEDVDLGEQPELQQYAQYLKAVRVDGVELRITAPSAGGATKASGSASVGAMGSDEQVLLARYDDVSLTRTEPTQLTLTDAGNARLSELVVQDGKLRVHVQGCVDAVPARFEGEVTVHAVVTAGL